MADWTAMGALGTEMREEIPDKPDEIVDGLCVNAGVKLCKIPV